MSENQVAQWDVIADKFRDAAKEQKAVLAYHYDAYNRGWLGGLQLGRQQALMFSHSAKSDSSLIPAELKEYRSDEDLFDAFIAFLVGKVQKDADELDESRNDDLDDFRKGRLAGLKEWKTTGRF